MINKKLITKYTTAGVHTSIPKRSIILYNYILFVRQNILLNYSPQLPHQNLNDGNRLGITENNNQNKIRTPIRIHDSTVKLLLHNAFNKNMKNTNEINLIIKNFMISILNMIL